MTIALALKVNDGLVLTADSATTITSLIDVPGQDKTLNVFNNEEKITQLHRRLPIGFMYWGMGIINGHSINWHAKEIRSRLDGSNDTFKEWALDEGAYDLSYAASKVYEYFNAIFPAVDKTNPTIFGLLVGGYSANSGEPEVYTCQTVNSILSPPVLSISKDQSGSIWFGQPEAIFRLLRGSSLKLAEALRKLGVDPTLVDQYVNAILVETNINVVWPGMPIQDAIDLAKFLAETTINYSRFSAGANTVGGPVDIAAITHHEGFKWVSRKHYYPIHLNPKGAI